MTWYSVAVYVRTQTVITIRRRVAYSTAHVSGFSRNELCTRGYSKGREILTPCITCRVYRAIIIFLLLLLLVGEQLPRFRRFFFNNSLSNRSMNIHRPFPILLLPFPLNKRKLSVFKWQTFYFFSTPSHKTETNKRKIYLYSIFDLGTMNGLNRKRFTSHTHRTLQTRPSLVTVRANYH